jgi:hypothetical protein
MTSDTRPCDRKDCINGCGGARSDCPMTKGAPLEKAKTGRPSSYTMATAITICDRLSQGETLTAICADKAMPSSSMVYRWLEAHQEFREAYARARELQAHAIADAAVTEALEAEDAALGRLAFDARKWFASKVAPKVYGDKITQEHTGPGGGPVQLTWGDGSTS